MKTTLASLLLRRKELKTQTDLRNIIRSHITSFDPQVSRRMVDPTNSIEEVNVVIPKFSQEEIERECDYYSHMWRLADGAIQQANHTTTVQVPKQVMKDFVTGGTNEDGEIPQTLAALLTRRKMLAEKQKEVLTKVDFSNFQARRTGRLRAMDAPTELLKDVVKDPLYALIPKQLYYIRQLRRCEEAIQYTNAHTEIEVDDAVFADFVV
jgi:hypothetical protein